MILTKVSGAVGKAGRALKILIVEDSFMTARSLTRLLQDLGAEVGQHPITQTDSGRSVGGRSPEWGWVSRWVCRRRSRGWR